MTTVFANLHPGDDSIADIGLSDMYADDIPFSVIQSGSNVFVSADSCYIWVAITGTTAHVRFLYYTWHPHCHWTESPFVTNVFPEAIAGGWLFDFDNPVGYTGTGPLGDDPCGLENAIDEPYTFVARKYAGQYFTEIRGIDVSVAGGGGTIDYNLGLYINNELVASKSDTNVTVPPYDVWSEGISGSSYNLLELNQGVAIKLLGTITPTRSISSIDFNYLNFELVAQ